MKNVSYRHLLPRLYVFSLAEKMMTMVVVLRLKVIGISILCTT